MPCQSSKRQYENKEEKREIIVIIGSTPHDIDGDKKEILFFTKMRKNCFVKSIVGISFVLIKVNGSLPLTHR